MFHVSTFYYDFFSGFGNTRMLLFSIIPAKRFGGERFSVPTVLPGALFDLRSSLSKNNVMRKKF